MACWFKHTIKTTPADLRNMLDKSKLLVYAQRIDHVLIGAALVAVEGEVPADIHKAIVQKQRRIPDQILPQLLAQSAAEQAVLSHRFARLSESLSTLLCTITDSVRRCSIR